MKLKAANIAIAAMLIIPAALMVYKLGFHGYAFEKTLARTSYQVHLDLLVQPEADQDTVSVQAYLPDTDERQQIRAESNRADGAEILIMRGNNGRYSNWTGTAYRGITTANNNTAPRELHLSYSFEFLLATE